ncbi:unnamed protein product [Darwinula stevensoni]|uniref:dTCF n=1 Tax=Darwinula stevensoni TaxID=69355 RepID=A0A7R8XDU3_9CRUS|nr:unnamed protein product [Darwinula stevensoni]CAG0893857.1 unnamed protein product [Darwinula stevensoni]
MCAVKMPHVNEEGGEDLGSADEVKVFKEEGEEENEEQNLTEVKSSLINESEEDKSTGTHIPTVQPGFGVKNDAVGLRGESTSLFGKGLEFPPHPLSMGYIVSPYPYTNGTSHHLHHMAAAAGKFPSPLGFFGYPPPPPPPPPPVPVPVSVSLPVPVSSTSSADAQPPPAHMGIPPYPQYDHHKIPPCPFPAAAAAAAAAAFARSGMYPFPGPQYPHPMLTPEFAWASMYGGGGGGGNAGRGSPYASLPPSSISISTATSISTASRPPSISNANSKSPSLDPSSQGSHRGSDIRGDGKVKDRDGGHHHPHQGSSPSSSSSDRKKQPHVKKPLNAFMLYMKEMRAKVVAECTLKESAAINQILGRRWHALSREEQSKYYELARKERELHMQMYPGWTARESYAAKMYKKKKRKDKANDTLDQLTHIQFGVEYCVSANNMKKCRARYGLDQQSQWCKPCSGDDESGRLLTGSTTTAQPPPIPPLRPPPFPQHQHQSVPTPDPYALTATQLPSSHGLLTPHQMEYHSHHPVDPICPSSPSPTYVRKKKCIRYMEGSDGSLDNPGSVASSMGDAKTPDSESVSGSAGSGSGSDRDPMSLSSPALSLASPPSFPGFMLPSPSLSISSPPSGMIHSPGGPGLGRTHHHPIGANPHDVNNPLSVDQLTKPHTPGGNKPPSVSVSVVSVNT